jgi:Na+/proline symporter
VVGVIAFKTLIGALFLFWFMSVVLMTQKAMSNNKMSIREAGMLWVKALFVVLFVAVILTINFK